MRKALCILTISLAAAPIAPASALPIAAVQIDGSHRASAIIEVKGGYGHGYGHGWGGGPGHRDFGWSRGRKVGWGGYHCPPGQWKKGRC